MAIVENQMVEVKWNGRNKKHFIEKGYNFTKLGDSLLVKALDLTHGSAALVEVKCDYCQKNKHILFNQYYDQVIKVNRTEYACKDCGNIYNSKKRNNVAFKNYIECLDNNFEDIIYKINHESLDKLNNEQKMLINNVKRYCELNGKFPTEKDMANKNGYISRTQYYKYFNTKSFTDIYQYIYPILKVTKNKEIAQLQKRLTKPDKFKCTKCQKEKSFNLSNFQEGKANKYGLKTVCRVCQNEYSLKNNYKQRGITFDSFEDVSPQQWWEHLYEGKIGYLPDFCLTEENIIKIIRYVFLEKLNYSREDLINLSTLNQSVMKKYKVYHLYCRYYNKLKFLQMCFPEYNIKAYELPITYYNEEVALDIIGDWINENKVSVEDILLHNYSYDRCNPLGLLAARKFNCSDPQMFTWYFSESNILNPFNCQPITTLDFKYKPNNYWSNQENRIKAVRNYCESNNIADVYNDTFELKAWIKKYYKQADIIKNIYDYEKFHCGAYESLIEAYPHIKDEGVLFSWEWHQVNINNRESLIVSLRELVLLREKLTSAKQISSFLRPQILMEKGYTKFVKHIQRKRFNSFFEWASHSFPEYKNQWTIEDFGGFYANDGTLCDSLEEVKIYEFIKDELNLDIEAIGVLYSGEHTFKLPENSVDKWYCPDFIINYEGQKFYVEYFGLYTDKVLNNKLLTNYRDKTHRKIKYYDSTGQNFIYLFREDIKDGFKGIELKLKNLAPKAPNIC